MASSTAGAAEHTRRPGDLVRQAILEFSDSQLGTGVHDAVHEVSGRVPTMQRKETATAKASTGMTPGGRAEGVVGENEGTSDAGFQRFGNVSAWARNEDGGSANDIAGVVDAAAVPAVAAIATIAAGGALRTLDHPGALGRDLLLPLLAGVSGAATRMPPMSSTAVRPASATRNLIP